MGKRTKKDFNKFSSRTSAKRRSTERSKRELMNILDSISVSYDDSLKLHTAYDAGRGRAPRGKGAREVISEGIFESSKRGFGFVKVEGEERDIFVPQGKTLGALDGDLVSVSYKKYKAYTGEERTEGRIKKIIKFGKATVIGTLVAEQMRIGRGYRRAFYVEPDDRSFKAELPVSDLGGARLGDKVLAKIVRAENPYCDITEVFGPSDTREANYHAILADEEIETEFSPEELSLAERVAKEEISAQGRVDRRSETIFTIDSESAKDLDDAISVRKTKGGYRLSVHIADVSHYVPERSALERCAMRRATSVYFTDKVVPMLPEALSNGACSLNAGEDKYALSCIIDVDTAGNIVDVDITESVINSRVRGVYSEINRLLSGDEDATLRKKYKDVATNISRAVELYEILKKRSAERGAIDFDAPEAEILLDGQGEVTRITKRERGLSERMIEQFMLLANEAVATTLREREIPCVYRIHEMPPEDKLDSVKIYLQNLGFNVGAISREPKNPIHYQRLLHEAEERGISMPVSHVLLRAMSKARYSDKHESHFGLGIENYCHFTSPIRRLSDLATHRIIKRVLLSGKRAESYASFARRAAVSATEGELRAVSAERRIDNLYKTIYMSRFVGESFTGVVSGVTSFGIFVTLDNTVEGIVPLSEMRGSFVFDERTMKLRSSHTTFSLGDGVTVRLVECDVSGSRIRFEIIGEEK